MPDPDRDDEHPVPDKAYPAAQHDQQDEPMEDEEKVLAGRADANIPAMLTKDVPGG